MKNYVVITCYLNVLILVLHIGISCHVSEITNVFYAATTFLCGIILN